MDRGRVPTRRTCPPGALRVRASRVVLKELNIRPRNPRVYADLECLAKAVPRSIAPHVPAATCSVMRRLRMMHRI